MRNRNIIIISIALNFLTLLYIVKKFYIKYQTKPYPRTENLVVKEPKIKYFLNRDELFENLPIESNSVIFLGNSLTQNFEISEFFHDLKIKNRGINGDVIPGIIKRINPIIKAEPKKIFLEIGINDLGRGELKDNVVFNYKKLIDIIRLRLPNTELYVQSIFPTELYSEDLPIYCTKNVNKDVVKVNDELLKYASVKKYHFIDTYRYFEKNGCLNKDYSVDGVHLNSKGYKLWAKVLKPYIDQ
ncbi:MAG: GDSL-type esterase/lipase family protein [Bacteroidota bacterium]